MNVAENHQFMHWICIIISISYFLLLVIAKTIRVVPSLKCNEKNEGYYAFYSEPEKNILLKKKQINTLQSIIKLVLMQIIPAGFLNKCY